MRVDGINFDKLIKVDRNKPNVTLYRDNQYYYKLWDKKHTSPHYYMDGMNYVWMGYDKMAVCEVGLVNSTICNAFVDLIYDSSRVCGYITKVGVTNNIEKVSALTFLKLVAENSKSVGYSFMDVSRANIVRTDIGLSMIDFDDPPFKLESMFRLDDDELDAVRNLMEEKQEYILASKYVKEDDITKIYARFLDIMIWKKSDKL